MKSSVVRWFLVLVALPAGAAAQDAGALSGVIADSSTGQPIPGAYVRVDHATWSVRANSDGYFAISPIAAGRHSIRVNVLGYVTRTVDLYAGAPVSRILLTPAVYEINPVTVTATRERSLLSDAPASVDVVTLRDIEDGGIQDVAGAIEHIPGVVTYDYGALGDIKTVSLRGSTSGQVLVLLDGQRMNSAQSGDVDLSTIPLSGVQSVEVVRGGASAMYGADAVGGVVNIITSSGFPERGMSARANLLAGSFGTRGFETGGTFSSGAMYSTLSYKYIAANNDFGYRSPQGLELTRSDADFNSHALYARTGWKLDDSPLPKTLALSGEYFYSEGGSPGTFDFPDTTARKKSQNGWLNLLYEQKLGSPYHTLRLRTYYQNMDFAYDDPSGYVPTHSFYHTIAWGAEAQERADLAGWNTLTGGYAFRYDHLTSLPVTGGHQRTLNGLFLQDEIAPAMPGEFPLRRVALIPAVRWDRFSDFGGQVSPKVGLVASIGSDWELSLKGNFGRSFRAPAFNDLYWPADPYMAGNPNLKPERGTDFDIGLLFQDPGFLGISAGVTYFRNEITDLIIWQPDATGFYSPGNIGKSLLRGIESRISVTPLRGLLRLEWNSTFLDARDRTEVPGEYDSILPFRPKHVNAVSARVDLSDAYIMLTGSHYASRFTSTANTTALDPYTLVDAVVGYTPDLQPRWLEVRLAMRNIGNLNYQVMDGYPMPGREVRLSVQFSYSSAAALSPGP